MALGANSIANQPNTVSVGAPGAERRITNVAPGIAPTDAVNVSQLQGLQSQVAGVQTEERRGIAAAIAANGYTTPVRAGGTTVGVSGGFFHGESAVGMSLAHRLAWARISWSMARTRTAPAPKTSTRLAALMSSEATCLLV